MKTLSIKIILFVFITQHIYTFHAMSNPAVSTLTRTSGIPETVLGIDVGIDKEHRELFRRFGFVFCAKVAAGYYVRNHTVIRTTEEVRKKKMSPKKTELLKRLGKIRRGKLSQADKVSNFFTKLMTGTVIGFSGAICGAYLTNEAIYLIDNNPTLAYNTNQTFKNMVNEFGIDSAMEIVQSFEGKTIEERFDILSSQKPDIFSEEHNSFDVEGSGDGDFFDAAPTTEIEK